jgi:hypothetical protein
MKSPLQGFAVADPKHWIRQLAETCQLSTILMISIHYCLKTKWRQCLDIELSASYEVRHGEVDVMNHAEVPFCLT